jgi:cellulose synthase/poly-beta-1,6-N-acetylglucosamine synthase-like glycosyltransferase
MKISVLVPVYKEPKFLVDIARKIQASTHPDREVVAVVDGALTEPIRAALDELGGAVTVLAPGDHLGKAGALNRAALGLATDALLFLDNDILLPDDPEFLSVLHSELETHDIVDLPKEVLVQSGFSSMIGYEYQGLAMASLAFSKIAHRSPGLIGAAFAVKKDLFARLEGFRKVVHEDGDFGARAFRLHARYSFRMRLKVKTSMPDTLKEWVTQRKRWTLINVLWFKENFLHLLASVFTQPALLPTLLFIILPTILSFALFAGLNFLHLAWLDPFVFMVGTPFQVAAGVILWLSHHELVAQGLLSTALGFAVAAGMYLWFCWLGKFRFHLLSFAVFYFLYMPVLVVINLVMFVTQFRQTRVKLDWKT